MYAYRIPNGDKDVVETWDECKVKVDKVSGAEYKRVASKAEGENWIHEGECVVLKCKDIDLLQVLINHGKKSISEKVLEASKHFEDLLKEA